MKQVIRFGISNGDKYRATTWKLWTPPGKADVYLAARPLGGYLKVSLHESGSWHFAYSKSTFDNLFDDPIPMRDRFIEKWSRPQPLISGDILAFRIVTPYSSVTSLVSESDLKVTWIPNCPPSKATEVDILISPPTNGSKGWPGKSGMGTNLIGSYSLKNN